MEISRYLAMTAAEAEDAPLLPDGFAMAYMACHFSPYGTGLTNIPRELPAGSMLILNDRTPVFHHDPHRILVQLRQCLEETAFESLLLDFQRPGQEDTAAICRLLTQELPCRVGVSECYARDLPCPVFLQPLPLVQMPEEALQCWQGREVWLDTAPQAVRITVTEAGSRSEEIPFLPPPENTFRDDGLFCLYRAEVTEAEIRFHLWRNEPVWADLARRCQSLGVTKILGLYQEYSLEYSFKR